MTARELGRIRATILEVEGYLDHAVLRVTEGLSSDEIAAFQKLDLVAQSTEALAKFLDTLSQDPHCADRHAEALSAVHLEEMAHRLSGETTLRHIPKSRAELF